VRPARPLPRPRRGPAAPAASLLTSRGDGQADAGGGGGGAAAPATAAGGRGSRRDRQRNGLRRGGGRARRAQGRRARAPQGQPRRRGGGRREESVHRNRRRAGAVPVPDILRDHEGSRRPRVRPGNLIPMAYSGLGWIGLPGRRCSWLNSRQLISILRDL
jgi:hypothetical protein